MSTIPIEKLKWPMDVWKPWKCRDWRQGVQRCVYKYWSYKVFGRSAKFLNKSQNTNATAAAALSLAHVPEPPSHECIALIRKVCFVCLFVHFLVFQSLLLKSSCFFKEREVAVCKNLSILLCSWNMYQEKNYKSILWCTTECQKCFSEIRESHYKCWFLKIIVNHDQYSLNTKNSITMYAISWCCLQTLCHAELPPGSTSKYF